MLFSGALRSSAGPLSPPFSNASRDVMTSPPLFFSPLWQEKQFVFSRRMTSVVFSAAPASEKVAPSSKAEVMNRMTMTRFIFGQRFVSRPDESRGPESHGFHRRDR